MGIGHVRNKAYKQALWSFLTETMDVGKEGAWVSISTLALAFSRWLVTHKEISIYWRGRMHPQTIGKILKEFHEAGWPAISRVRTIRYATIRGWEGLRPKPDFENLFDVWYVDCDGTRFKCMRNGVVEATGPTRKRRV